MKTTASLKTQLMYFTINYLNDGGTMPPTKNWIKDRFTQSDDRAMIAQVAIDFQSKN